MTTIDWKEWDFVVNYYLQFVDTAKYISKDIFICIIEAQSNDQEQSQWKH